MAPPTGLMYVASSLRAAGHQVKIIDAEVYHLPISRIIKEIAGFNPDVVGAGATSPDFHIASRILKKVKEISKEITTIVGGPHPTALPAQVLSEESHIDYVIRYEGEITTPKLIDTLENGGDIQKVNGVSYRNKEGDIKHNPDRDLLDVNRVPWPARDLIDQKKYSFHVHGKGSTTMTTFQTSRGCPNRCTFCYRMFKNTVRFRHTQLIVDELESCVNEYGTRFIYFIDDTFTYSIRRVIEICDEILNRRLDFYWLCLTRADALDTEMLSKMRKAGCTQVSIGVESGNQRILNGVGKGTTLEQYRRGYRLLKKFGFETRGSFILGLPYETKETIRDTIKLAKELDLDRAFFNILTPYPGTEVYEQALEGDGVRLVTNDWKEFKRWGNSVIELDGITREELVELQKKAMTEFYARPRIILRHIQEFLKGEHSAFYYRPLWYAIGHYLHLDCL